MVRRGDIYYADLGERVGSEQSGTRPVLVVQNDMGNRYSQTFVVVPLTTRRKSSQPTHVYLPLGACCNLEPSTLLAEHIITVDGSRLLSYVGHIASCFWPFVDRALSVSIGLTV